jgi:ATP-dependent DNA helicase RecQ
LTEQDKAKEKALNYLNKVLGSGQASFKEDQWESIWSLVDKNNKNKTVLVVQKTGWGKSIVYFIATKLLRDEKRGFTILISPLLSLMRNQIDAAEKLGITAKTINSANEKEWPEIKKGLQEDKVDLLLISPERLNNEEFKEFFESIFGNIGLFVVDEVHCISDWGHDFRPDYKLIARVLKLIPKNVPILATTATANDRVIEDIKNILGNDIVIKRGSLMRSSLILQNIKLSNYAERIAWLAKNIPLIPGSGIIYVLTVNDAEIVAKWLQKNGIAAEPYYSDIDKKEKDTDKNKKEELEQKLLNNEIKVLVATVALGMGFDKPDLSFVIHFQRPASVVHYYQQVGRAGRAIEKAYGIMLCGEEDDNISNYFIKNAFPSKNHIEKIIQVLKESGDGLKLNEIVKKLNIPMALIEKALKFLSIESPSPIVKNDSKWKLTPNAYSYKIDVELINKITEIRKKEQRQMHDYMDYSECLMSFLRNALNDSNIENCNKCKNCNPTLSIDEKFDKKLYDKAVKFLNSNYIPIKHRKRWPEKDILKDYYDIEGLDIPLELQAEEGLALCLWRDSGWGKLVAKGKYEDNEFSDELVEACAKMFKEMFEDNNELKLIPTWATCIPSFKHPDLVPNFAKKLADKLNLKFIPCIEKVSQNEQQKDMENSYFKVKNLCGVFKINLKCLKEPCLLIDDVIDSGWTFTVAAALLHKAGCANVYPMALASNYLN